MGPPARSFSCGNILYLSFHKENPESNRSQPPSRGKGSPGLSGYEIVQLSTELSSSFPGELDFCAETGRGSGASSPPALTSPHPGVTKTKKLRIWYLPPLIALWLLIDLLFGVPIVWKLTRTEAWVTGVASCLPAHEPADRKVWFG